MGNRRPGADHGCRQGAGGRQKSRLIARVRAAIALIAPRPEQQWRARRAPPAASRGFVVQFISGGDLATSAATRDASASRRANNLKEKQEASAAALELLKSLPMNGDVAPPIVVVRDGRLAGIVPLRSGLWPMAMRDPALTVEALARPDYVLARETDLLSSVFARMNRRGKSAALVVAGEGVPCVADIRGVITKRSIANAVILAAE